MQKFRLNLILKIQHSCLYIFFDNSLNHQQMRNKRLKITIVSQKKVLIRDAGYLWMIKNKYNFLSFKTRLTHYTIFTHRRI